MAKLDVSAAFLITVGRGNGAETWVIAAVSDQDGKPVPISFPRPLLGQLPIDVFVTLSAMFGAFEIPLRVVEVQSQPLGFYGLRVEAPPDLVVRLEAIRPAALGVVVNTGLHRGQALARAPEAAEVTAWLADRVQDVKS
ncbi:MAG: hypothetical protein ABI835_10205 [Chloroflexota bacterium]